MDPLPLSYVVPLRLSDDDSWPELAVYLAATAQAVDEVIVVDGSPAPLLDRHRETLAPGIAHLPPHGDLSFAMGKVNGVVSGLREARNEAVVLADDDVRWTRGALARALAALGAAELVRPQNYFEPLPWHARLDTARTLLNRAVPAGPGEPAADFPGTLAVRRSAFLGMGGYDGNALFENLELIRTVRAAGGRVESPLDLYVARRPPSTRHFRSQRVRQAYDEFALPWRLATWLAALPAAASAVAVRRYRALATAWVAVSALAETGRRRAGGARVFPASSSLLAPAWVLERAACSWLALGARLLRGGVRYGEGRLHHAATPQRVLDRRYRRDSAPDEVRLEGEPATVSRPR